VRSLNEYIDQGGQPLRLAMAERLDALRSGLESESLDAIATAVLRGRIAELKSMLSKPAPMVPSGPGYGANISRSA